MVISLTVFGYIWINHDASHQDIQDQTSPPVTWQWKIPWCSHRNPNSGFSKTPRLITGGEMIHHVGMDQYLLIPFLVGWTSIYQLFWCELQGYKVLTHCHVDFQASLLTNAAPWIGQHCHGIDLVIHLATCAARHCQKRFLKLWQEKH